MATDRRNGVQPVGRRRRLSPLEANVAHTHWAAVDHAIIDFHVHAKLSKLFPFEFTPFWQTVEQAKRIGLDAVVLTEHFHAPDFWQMYEVMAGTLPYSNGVFVLDGGFRVLTGAELGTKEGCDLLALGTLHQLRRLDVGLPRRPSAGYRPTCDEAVECAHYAGVFLIGAHMYRPKKELAKITPAALSGLDAFEANGKDFHLDRRVATVAREMKKPMVGGSDAHCWPQVGIKATELPIPPHQICHASVIEAVRHGRTGVNSLGYGPLAVRISEARKAIAKARRARHTALAAAGVASRPSPVEAVLPDPDRSIVLRMVAS
jgi:histidinol phosphatase-like PHP family hydrolase